MVDLDRIHQRLELLGDYLRELQRLRDLPVAEYLRHEVYAGRYLVQVAAQTCIELANHVIDSEGWRAPRDVGDSFTILHEHGVIRRRAGGTASWARRVAQSAGARLGRDRRRPRAPGAPTGLPDLDGPRELLLRGPGAARDPLDPAQVCPQCHSAKCNR